MCDPETTVNNFVDSDKFWTKWVLLLIFALITDISKDSWDLFPSKDFKKYDVL